MKGREEGQPFSYHSGQVSLAPTQPQCGGGRGGTPLDQQTGKLRKRGTQTFLPPRFFLYVRSSRTKVLPNQRPSRKNFFLSRVFSLCFFPPCCPAAPLFDRNKLRLGGTLEKGGHFINLSSAGPPLFYPYALKAFPCLLIPPLIVLSQTVCVPLWHQASGLSTAPKDERVLLATLWKRERNIGMHYRPEGRNHT